VKTQFRFLAVLLLAFASGGILLLLLRPLQAEPVFQGKPLREWLKGFDAAQQSAEYAAAEAALQQMGTNALPALISYLRRQDPPFHRQWTNLRSKLRLSRGRVEYATLWHRRAALACGALGEAAAPAFPAMAEAMNDPDAAHAVGNGLSRMLPASAPVLTNVLATGNVAARSSAAFHLVTAFSHSSAESVARPALLSALLHDPEPAVRTSAASALAHWNTNVDEIASALACALNDPNPSVRGNAVTSLGNFGVAAKTAVPQLMKLLQDTNSYVRGTVADRAALMLQKIDPEAAARAGVKPTRTGQAD
jgi:HEAT repeat protein